MLDFRNNQFDFEKRLMEMKDEASIVIFCNKVNSILKRGNKKRPKR